MATSSLLLINLAERQPLTVSHYPRLAYSASPVWPVHARQQSCRKQQQIVAEAIVAENGNIVA